MSVNKIVRIAVGICLVPVFGLAWVGRRPSLFDEFKRKGICLQSIRIDRYSGLVKRGQLFWINLSDRAAAIEVLKASGYHCQDDHFVPTSVVFSSTGGSMTAKSGSSYTIVEPLVGSYSNRNPFFRFLPSHDVGIELVPYVGYKLSYDE